MKATLWSLSGLATELGKDRRSLERQLTELEPDESEEKNGKAFNRYYMARVVAHLMGGAAMDYAAERTRLTKEQADKTEMENALNRGELIKRDEVVREVGGIVHAVKTRLLALPSQISSYLANKDATDIQGQLTDAIYETLTELAEGDFESVPSAEAVDC